MSVPCGTSSDTTTYAAYAAHRATTAATAVTTPAVAIGVDVTWFGGSGKRSEEGSRMECIAYALKSKEGWGKPEFQRVTLSSTDADFPAPSEHQETAEKQGVLVFRTGVVAWPCSKTHTVELQRRKFGAPR
jgi:hypothetical protein